MQILSLWFSFSRQHSTVIPHLTRPYATTMKMWKLIHMEKNLCGRLDIKHPIAHLFNFAKAATAGDDSVM